VPILDVQLIGPVPDAARAGLSQRLADAAGMALASRPQGTWVTVRIVDGDDYAENGGAPAGAAPVLVRVLQYAPPRGEALAAEVGRLTRAVAEACGRAAENVHLVYEPPAQGRIAFGGELRR
jgi:hypothetical protein